MRITAFIYAILLGAKACSPVLRELGGDELIERALMDLPVGPSSIIICISGCDIPDRFLSGLDRTDLDHLASGVSRRDQPWLRPYLVHDPARSLPGN